MRRDERCEGRRSARPVVLLLVVAIALRLLWVPFHLAVEQHHGIGGGVLLEEHEHGHAHAHAHEHVHVHAGAGECTHEPHPAEDHEAEVFAAQRVAQLAPPLGMQAGALLALALAPAGIPAPSPSAPPPRGRSPCPVGSRAPPCA